MLESRIYQVQKELLKTYKILLTNKKPSELLHNCCAQLTQSGIYSNIWIGKVEGEHTLYKIEGARNAATAVSVQQSKVAAIIETTNKQKKQLTKTESEQILTLPIKLSKKTGYFIQYIVAGEKNQFSPEEIEALEHFTESLTQTIEEIITTKEITIMKYQFLANIKHELRTPLNGIIGMTDLLSTTKTSAEQNEYLSILKNSAEHLHSQISNLLHYTQLIEQKHSPVIEAINISKIIAVMTSQTKKKAKTKGIEIYSESNHSIKEIYTDKYKVMQILQEVLDNAVKFTEVGSISITTVEEPDKEQISIIITDTGIGIPLNGKISIFDPFVQLEKILTKNHNGLGIGLAITKKLVNLLNGTINITSEEYKGTTVTITLPYRLELPIKAQQ